MSEHFAEAGHHAAAGAGHAGAGVKGTLGKRLGPMPVGGWLLAVAGGVVVALYFRNKSAANAPTDPTATDPTATGTGDFTTNGGMFQADPGGTYAGVGNIPGTTDQGGNPPTPPTHPTHSAAAKARAAKTNPEWEHWSVEAMVGLGFSRDQVRSSLSAYLAGHHLTQAEDMTVTATVARCGPPPHRPAKVPGPGSGQPKPTPPPHHHHHPRDNGGGAVHTPPRTPTHT